MERQNNNSIFITLKFNTMKLQKIVSVISFTIAIISTSCSQPKDMAKGNYSIDSIRSMAGKETSKMPVSVNAFITGEGYFPGWTIYKGNKEKEIKSAYTAFQVVYNDYSVVIDIPFSQDQFKDFKYGRKYHSQCNKALKQAIDECKLIVITHEHRDHTCGLLNYVDNDTIKNKMMFTPEQVSNKEMKKTGFPKDFFNGIKLLEYKNYYQLSPGIVLIKSPGHTPGHQMLYVKLQNGEEYLLIGDVAWNMKNIELQKQRPWLVRFMLKEDKDKIAAQLRWLQKIQNEIKIVPSHDIEMINTLKSEHFHVCLAN
jgi:glyoxylase-like metal-dependent hydrolase (beta-lactamase superfamily II)